jgi:threonine-phosphate decarboxylase
MSNSIPPHGGQLRHIAATFNIPAGDLLDFSANINPEGPPPSVLSTLRASLDDPTTLTTYPDLDQFELRQAIARYTGVTPQHIAVANGFVPLLEAALHTLPIRRCLLPLPCFSEYRPAVARGGIEAIPCTLNAEVDFAYDLDAMFAEPHDSVLIANPQNPSGVLHDREFMLTLVERAAQKSIHVLLDEAFIDYAPNHSLVTFTDRFPNLIVFRSVTKFHGIPGLRAAYAIANPALASAITASIAPWPITTLASLAVIAALDHHAFATRALALNQVRRAQLQDDLEQLGLTTYPSAANYILFRLPRHLDATTFWRQMIVHHHIVLRGCSNYETLPAGHLRSAVRTEKENRQLIAALKEELSR